MIMDVIFVTLSGNVWVVAIAYAFFMAFSGFVLVPDQTHALNQLPARLNADGSAAMNTIQQLAGAIGTAVAGSYMTAFPRSMMVFTVMAVLGVILAALMFRFSTRRPPELVEVR